MKRLTVFSWHLLSCLKCTVIVLIALSVAASGYEEFEENWKLFEVPDSKFRRLNDTLGFRATGNFFKKFDNFTDEATVLLFTDKCSRYCIENVSKDIPYINLFWTTNGENMKDQSLGNNETHLILNNKWSGVRNTDVIPRNCQIYLELDCNTDEIKTNPNSEPAGFRVNRENSGTNGNEFMNDPDTPARIKIAEEYNLTEGSETRFLVNESLQRIIINIDGNFTGALLQLPTDATASRHGAAMSWVHKGTEGMRIDTRNGPPGEWRVKLLGVDNSKYHVAAVGFLSGGNSDEKNDEKLLVSDLRLDDDSNGNSVSNYQSQLKPNKPKEKGDELMDDQKHEELRSRSSIEAIESLEDMDVKTPMQNVSMKLTEDLDNRELSEKLVTYNSKSIIEEKKILIEVNRNSNLLATPGTIHKITFDVMNTCVLPVIYTFRVKSTPFRVYNVRPISAWIYPEQVANVVVDLVVPNNVAPDTANTVSLSILGTEIKEKSAYIYVQGSLSRLTDDAKPVVEYSYNSNCAGKLNNDRCYKSRWSVDLTIQDYDSGLKRVLSSPNDIYPRTEFISGTRSPVTFYYSATCCDKTVKITAIDLLNNYNTITIDVTAWNNLSEAEIAAITVGALLGLLFIILIVILIIYCVRRRKSHDLPYTQRYGSTRPPAQSERF